VVEIEGLDDVLKMLKEISDRAEKASLAIVQTKDEEDQAEAIREKLLLHGGLQEALPLIKADTEGEAKEAVDQGYPVPEYLSKDIEDYIAGPASE
jgi:hypothetical protein